MTSIRARIKEVTSSRAILHLQVEDIVKELNPIVRGWGVYFKRPGTGRPMTQIDQYVKLDWSCSSEEAAPLGDSLEAVSRPFLATPDRALPTVCGHLSMSSSANAQGAEAVGEPCAGKSHARFDGGRLETGRQLPRQSPTLPSNHLRTA